MARKHIIHIAVLGLALAPAIASAQGFLNTLQNIIQTLGQIVQTLLPIVFALAILAFFYGIFRYIFSGGADEKASAKHVMIWSLVAIFVMASLFGIIQLAQSTLGINQGSGNLTPTGINGL